MPESDPLQRGNTARSTRRDVERLERRESDQHFWRSLSVIGSVGWPIVLLAIGGALLGRSLDARFDTGVRITFTLLALGASLGSWLAWSALKVHKP